MNRKRILQLCILSLITALVIPLCVVGSSFNQKTQTANKDADKGGGAGQLFAENCAKCHGKDGRAKTFRGRLVGARNFTDEQWQERVTDEQIATAIRKGPKEMPAFENKLSPTEIEQLVVEVRRFKSQAHDRQNDKPVSH